MSKREKKMDGFVRKMRKGVKGLWKVLKHPDRLPFPERRVMMRTQLSGLIMRMLLMIFILRVRETLNAISRSILIPLYDLLFMQ